MYGVPEDYCRKAGVLDSNVASYWLKPKRLGERFSRSTIERDTVMLMDDGLLEGC